MTKGDRVATGIIVKRLPRFDRDDRSYVLRDSGEIGVDMPDNKPYDAAASQLVSVVCLSAMPGHATPMSESNQPEPSAEPMR
jgi:hypothetical protein